MRLFVALYPTEAAIEHLRAAVDELHVGRARQAGINARVTRTDTWHITLAFLGELVDERADAAADALGAAVSAWLEPAARASPPLSPADSGPSSISIAGGGTFGRGRFTVLWAGLVDGVEPVRGLAMSVAAQLRRAKLPFDRKPFRPHLTIARVGDRLPAEAVADDVAALGRYRGPSWSPTHAYLVRSELGPQPVYTRLAAIPLR